MQPYSTMSTVCRRNLVDPKKQATGSLTGTHAFAPVNCRSRSLSHLLVTASVSIGPVCHRIRIRAPAATIAVNVCLTP